MLSHDAGASRIEHIVETIAIKIVESQRISRAEVKLRGTFCLERWTPASGQRSEEPYLSWPLRTRTNEEHIGQSVWKRKV